MSRLQNSIKHNYLGVLKKNKNQKLTIKLVKSVEIKRRKYA